ncbi:4'-phosphopantetheinyl transferase EntD (siderophore biosynthesis) [Saccharopolyspora antimicrobica]|uniref:4'-phosphopantetheinyl transferase EntD n=1 Tax=Saccharopolyspora antimicrobica TaxID=455193 RepID=A0A1I4S8L8_9PSEU|nr:4'-phosphopantetheinyl transferase superfamily protein [Saccharopolyspora antimicrobica]RKT87640.1 4'-phosphopantetheinyl transferase EntD [Saccharopolyspora antimicrobica]SFM60837.1 4'-phosphopantetheinyl transferase EntD (siderophore biosynthesis) [Saccharopolyspora antimicrobica]
MIERLLPAEVSCVETVTDPPGADLFPEEEAIIARAVGKRRREFTTARWCARQALDRIGVAPVPVLPGERGAPQWPAGIVGSITHCAGYRAAVVAHQEKVQSLGIDAEPHEALPDGVLDAVSLPDERTHLTELSAADPPRHWDRILFSCKETVYKTWYPITREWLGFEDARLHLDPSGTFTAQLLKPGADRTGTPLTSFTGRWLVENSLIITAIAHL